jgi:hypothetical protein
MTLPTGTFTTFSAVGNREDLSDIIYRIAPTETPFMSMCETVKATNKTHEWQTQALATAAQNAQLEGDDADASAAVATARLTNICQISAKIPRVSNTQQAIDHAGRDDELAYQTMLKGLELRRDMETILTGGGGVSGQVKAAGDATTAPKLANLLTWVTTNDVMGASGTSPTAADGTDARGDDTQRAFTEAQLRAALALCYESGGKPNVIMLGSFNKQVFSTFTGRATPTEDTKGKKIVAAVDTYVSDFGTLKVVPNVFQRGRDCWILQDDMWKIAYLRKFVAYDLAITGDSKRRAVYSEYTLEACNEKSSGGVFDLTVT